MDELDEQEIQFIDQPDYEINCPVCLELLTGEVCQTTCCGNHICSDCTTQLKATPNIKCPKCRDENFDAHLDIFFSRNLLNSKVRCSNSQAGCPWTGELRNLKQHVENNCNRGLTKCQHCENRVPSIEEHLLVCGDFIIDCPNKCPDAKQKRKNFQDHLENKCPLRVITPTIANARMPQAANEVVQTVPLSFTMTHFGQHLESGDPWYSPPFYTHDRGYKMNIRVDADLLQRGAVSVRVCILKDEHDDTLEWPLHADVEVSLLNWREDANHVTKKLYLPGDYFCDRLLTENRAKWGKGDPYFLSHDELVYNADKNTEYLSYNCLTFQVKSVTIFPVHVHQNLPQWTMENCICHFPVTSFKTFKTKNNDVAFYGPPFYTHERGYKLSVAVYPNGFSDGKGTHVSVHASLWKGEYDDELAWPFNGDVIIEMLNWREDNDHKKVTISFSEGACAESTARVFGDAAQMTWRNHKFQPHSILSYDRSKNTEYLNTDCLLFKVKFTLAYSSLDIPRVPLWKPPRTLHEFTLNFFTARAQCNNRYYSKPFFTHPNGYKMQLRVDANENGYIGVYAYLMKGPNDDNLFWPFCGDVIVELVNWIEDAGHHQKAISFSPDIPIFLHNRVTTGVRNEGWGFSQFAPHSTVDAEYYNDAQLLNEDCLYFRVKDVAVYSNNSCHKLPRWHDPWVVSTFEEFTLNNFSKRREHGTTFYSSEFFTHDCGYKLRLEVQARRAVTNCQHVAVYARLLRSENDANLIWPFRASIVIKLINWRGDFNHHSYTLPFDERTPDKFSCQVLTEEKASDCWGTHTFIPYSSLGYDRGTNTEYLQDDCLRFKVNDVIVYSTPIAQKRPFWQGNTNFFEFTITRFSQLVHLDQSYYSTPFSTFEGYKMCLEVYPGGYGSGKGTHVTMFAHLMRGDNDDNLIWPFTADIAVDILNWKGDHNHHRKVLNYDNDSSDECRARVYEDDTLASGWGNIKVIPLDVLFPKYPSATAAYLEDDCMCVRVYDIAVYSTPLLNKKPQWQNSWFSSPSPNPEFTVTGVSKHMAYNSEHLSLPFYTHRNGYKMRLEVHPNGLDDGKGTHISIYARLLKGEFDNNLKWPMNVTLTVEIVNWRKNASHVPKMITFQNATYEACAQVTQGSKASSAWGFSEFCNHRTLFTKTRAIEYIQDDCLLVRIKGAIVHSRKGFFG